MPAPFYGRKVRRPSSCGKPVTVIIDTNRPGRCCAHGRRAGGGGRTGRRKLARQGCTAETDREVMAMAMWFGCNQNHYEDVAPDVPSMTMVRSFKALADTWPEMPDGLHSLWSIRPDPQELLAGQHDQTIIEALQSASALPGNLLTAWHEAEQASLPAATVQQVHAHMLELVHDNTTSVRYGAVLTQGGRAVWAIPGLDFYGIDIYDLQETTDPSTTLDRFDSRMPDGERLVAETNSSAVPHRPAWFREIYDWLAARDGIAMLTFWNPSGPLSGPWDGDAATRYALNRIKHDARLLA